MAVFSQVEDVAGEMVIGSVCMSYEMVEGTIIDAMLDALPVGYDSPKFAKLVRLLIAIRAQREMKTNTFGSRFPPGWLTGSVQRPEVP
jgi:hypothetical protein